MEIWRNIVFILILAFLRGISTALSFSSHLWQFNISTAALIYHFIPSSNRSSSVSATPEIPTKPLQYQSLLRKELIPINGCDFEDAFDTPSSCFPTGCLRVENHPAAFILFFFFPGGADWEQHL